MDILNYVSFLLQWWRTVVTAGGDTVSSALATRTTSERRSYT